MVALDNELIRVVRVHYAPHETAAMHDLSKLPTIYVYLSDSLDHPGPVPLVGAFRVSPGGVELSDTPTHFLRVELKQVALGNQAFAHRQERPADVSRTGRNVEFDAHQIAVERIIVARKQEAVKIEPGTASLLIALAPVRINVTGKPRSFSAQMTCGDLYWMDASKSATLHGFDGASAEALRVVFRK